MKLKRFILAAGISAATTVGVMAQKAPEPCGLVPSERQLEWYDREMIAFFHFGLNTFEEFVNEGNGKAPAALFNPTALDCTQWMQVLKSAGIPAAILTAKHAAVIRTIVSKTLPGKTGKGMWYASLLTRARNMASRLAFIWDRTIATNIFIRTIAPNATSITMQPN